MNSTTILILVATVAVIALTLIPTYIISGRKKTTQADWEVADRSLPLYVVIGTQFASAMGGGILVAHVGNAYARGIGHFIYGVLASLPFIIIMVLAKWLRRNNFTTIPDVLAHFTNGNKLIRIVAGVMTVFVPFGWVTSQITAFGNIYSNLTGIDYTLLCVLFAVFALAFVMPSGLKTVAWTDFIFSCFMIVMCIVCVVFVTVMGGGIHAGNATKYAEFNIVADPEAASVVFSSGVKTVMIGLDATNCCLQPRADIELLRADTALGQLVPAMLTDYADVYKQVHNLDGMIIHDAISAVYLWKPELFSCLPCRIEVCLIDGEHLGQTVPEAGDTCLAATSCDAQAVREEILSMMKQVIAAH